MNTITTVTSPRGFRARFELMARAGELSIIGEPIPEVAVETSRRGYGAATRERAQRVIARAVRMGWAVVTLTASASEAPAEPAEWLWTQRCQATGETLDISLTDAERLAIEAQPSFRGWEAGALQPVT